MSKANISLMTLTVIATAALVANRCVTLAGAYPAAGGLALGVTRSDAAVDGLVPVDVYGAAVLVAGAAITAGATLMAGTDGKAITHDGDGDKHPIGRALEAATGDGSLLEVLLVPSAGLLVTAV
jgi:Uncharacterized conserved protein (DUF2190)